MKFFSKAVSDMFIVSNDINYLKILIKTFNNNHYEIQITLDYERTICSKSQNFQRCLYRKELTTENICGIRKKCFSMISAKNEKIPSNDWDIM